MVTMLWFRFADVSRVFLLVLPSSVFDLFLLHRYQSFHFAHIVILFVGITFLTQAIFFVSLIAKQNRKLLFYDSCSSESLFVEYIQLHESKNSFLQWLFSYGPVSFPFPELREKIEFKILQEFFIRSYHLDPKFKFANYMAKVLKNYIISLVEVRPINWFRVAFIVGLNEIRIAYIDPIFQSHVCEEYPYHPKDHHSGHSEHYYEHVCPEYTLRVIFLGTVLVSIYFLCVLFSSEIYIQRLIGKVLDDEETLQWLDTEVEVVEELQKRNSYSGVSAFPHPLELLGPGETYHRDGSSRISFGKSGGSGESTRLPIQGNYPRFPSASETTTLNPGSEEEKNRRKSLRRSFSYGSPLNQNDDALPSPAGPGASLPVHEAAIPPPPVRGLKERDRRPSITINVPSCVHVPAHPREGSVNSSLAVSSLPSEDTKALTTPINSWNRRHLYLKCLERIINVEYSYHENEARRTSIASESEMYLGPPSSSIQEKDTPAPRLTRNNSHRLRSATVIVHHRHEGSIGSVTGGGGSGKFAYNAAATNPDTSTSAVDLSHMKMKEIRELMIRTRSVKDFEDGGVGADGTMPTSPVSRKNSSGLPSPFQSFNSRKRTSIIAGQTSSSPGPKSGSLILDASSLSNKEKKSNDIPMFDNPMKQSKDKGGNSLKTTGIEMTALSPTATTDNNQPDSHLSKDITRNFFEFEKKKDASAAIYKNLSQHDHGDDEENQLTPSERIRAGEEIDPIPDWIDACCRSTLSCLQSCFEGIFLVIDELSMLITHGGHHDTSKNNHHNNSKKGSGKTGTIAGGQQQQQYTAVDDIKELEKDFKAIFFRDRPSYYYITVEFCLLLQCMYVALWATNFIILANSSEHHILWHFALLLPMLLNFFLLIQIIYIACMLQSIIKIDSFVANKICEEAIEERTVTQRLRRLIRDQLKELNSEKKYWKNELYSKYSEVMDENEEITRKEWKIFLHSFGLHLTNHSTKQLFQVIDNDQDGFISWNDLYILIFPDLIKKKIRIHRKKSKKMKRSTSQEEVTSLDSGGHSSSKKEEETSGDKFSVEYHISDEDRQSYKKKTPRASLLTGVNLLKTSVVNAARQSFSTGNDKSPSKTSISPTSPTRKKEALLELQDSVAVESLLNDEERKEKINETDSKQMTNGTVVNDQKETAIPPSTSSIANLWIKTDEIAFEEKNQTKLKFSPPRRQQQQQPQEEEEKHQLEEKKEDEARAGFLARFRSRSSSSHHLLESPVKVISSIKKKFQNRRRSLSSSSYGSEDNEDDYDDNTNDDDDDDDTFENGNDRRLVRRNARMVSFEKHHPISIVEEEEEEEEEDGDGDGEGEEGSSSSVSNVETEEGGSDASSILMQDDDDEGVPRPARNSVERQPFPYLRQTVESLKNENEAENENEEELFDI
jgi:hypothetical protein